MHNTYKKRPKGLGEVEQTVMDYVWAHGPCTAESCREALAANAPDEGFDGADSSAEA